MVLEIALAWAQALLDADPEAWDEHWISSLIEFVADGRLECLHETAWKYQEISN